MSNAVMLYSRHFEVTFNLSTDVLEKAFSFPLYSWYTSYTWPRLRVPQRLEVRKRNFPRGLFEPLS